MSSSSDASPPAHGLPTGAYSWHHNLCCSAALREFRVLRVCAAGQGGGESGDGCAEQDEPADCADPYVPRLDGRARAAAGPLRPCQGAVRTQLSHAGPSRGGARAPYIYARGAAAGFSSDESLCAELFGRRRRGQEQGCSAACGRLQSVCGSLRLPSARVDSPTHISLCRSLSLSARRLFSLWLAALPIRLSTSRLSSCSTTPRSSNRAVGGGDL